MQVAHGFEVINMLDGEALDRIAKHKPDFIVPEIEAIRTERFTITKTRYYCSSFCESGKFHNEPKSH
jgi:formate-dependent phosphoribosylglycinamide formyltransferase (GAR transformylase)